MSFFNFFRGTDNLGVGTGDLGLLQFQTIPAGGSYLGNTGKRQWNIQRSLGPVNSPGFMIFNKAVVPVPLTGSFGLNVHGQYVLQSLTEQKKG